MRTLTHLAAALSLVGPAFAQTDASGFDAEAAILDTAIPFAIGAREGRQALRGAFGWPTFQEGVVEGIYFRFDPDGYARFSPSPRLDQDVFEVVCRPASTACAARKTGISVVLDGRGRLQLRFEGVQAGDTFVLDDGLDPLPLGERPLHPLDPRMEPLL